LNRIISRPLPYRTGHLVTMVVVVGGEGSDVTT
jgi:hypothetical protein